MTANPYFEPASRQTYLWLAAIAWLGTPFSSHQRAPGSGVDCVQLAGAVYIATGFLDRFAPPDYNLDNGEHSDASTVLTWLDTQPRFGQLNRPSLAAGDLITFRQGRCPHHVAIVLAVNRDNPEQDATFIHTTRINGTAIGNLADPTWSKRLGQVYTPLES